MTVRGKYCRHNNVSYYHYGCVVYKNMLRLILCAFTRDYSDNELFPNLLSTVLTRLFYYFNIYTYALKVSIR